MIQFSMFSNKLDNKPKNRTSEWAELAKNLTLHKERTEKDGPLWSPTVYSNGSNRGNAGVDFVTAAVGDFDNGTQWADVEARLQDFEYVMHTTHTHKAEHPKFRVILPFAEPIPKSQWSQVKAQIDEHIFNLASDPAAKDPARIFYTPSCMPGAEREARHHNGKFLDPSILPPATKTYVAIEDWNEGTKQTMPLGKTALDFVANGAPMGEQRARAVAAARNYLSAGYSVAETSEALWRGLQASPQDSDRGPWTKDDATFIAQNIDGAEAPENQIIYSPMPPRSTIEKTALGYLFSFPSAGVTIGIEHLHRRSDGLKGEITVEASLPGVPHDLHWGSFNLSSLTTRKSLSKYLEERTKDGPRIEWDSIFEDFCRKVAFKEREGEPATEVGDLPDEEYPAWLIDSAVLNKEIGTIYGPGTTGKSRLALAFGLSVKTGLEFVPGFKPAEKGEVLYLDWETATRPINIRIKQLCRGMEMDFQRIWYLHCAGALADLYESISKEIEKHHIKFIIVDSVEAATTGTREAGADQNSAVMSMYQALRSFNTTTLLIDHVNSQQAGDRSKASRKPYGSIFKYNYARYAFDLRQTDATKTPGIEHLGMYCTKYNDGPLPEPVGIEVRFDYMSTVYSRETVTARDIAESDTDADAIRMLLGERPMYTAEIAQRLGRETNQVRTVLNRYKNFFQERSEGKRKIWSNRLNF